MPPPPTRPPILPGAQIELRDAVWRVERVDATSTGTHAWRCVGVSEIVRDLETVFLEEYEPEVRVLDPRETRLERDLSSQHQASLLYIESLLREVPPPTDGLYAGHRAAMDPLDYQLDPAWRALGQPRQRILIADAVGLGKTLEAGILLSELIRRGRARRILVATTRSMLTQFQKEMWARFTIPLVRLDSVGLARIRGQIPSHHNPFYQFDRTIISIDTLKQNNWFRTHVEKARWDVVVIDEAHNVASRGGGSQRAGIAARVARNCDSLILLSATPHDGKPESFASLMNLLDPTAIADPSRYTADDVRGLYVRRFKHDVEHQLARHVEKPAVMEAHAEASAEEERAFDLLTALELPALDAGAAGGILFRTGLTKALFSSPRACLAQLRSPLRRARMTEALPPPLRRELLDAGRTAASAALERAAAHLPAGDPWAADLRALAGLAAAVEAIGAGTFSKYAKLLETLGRIGWSVRRAREDRLLVFSERRETLAFLAERLTADLGLTDGQLEVLHGTLPDVEQQRIVEEFGKSASKLRVLLASDVASEGLNLHYLCHRLIHFDMPWSLMVFQQRNGRIDRYGQSEKPQIVYLQTDSANDEIRGDTRILTVLREKSEQALANIGDPSAFMGVFDVEAEEEITAQAIQSGTEAEELARGLDANLADPFARLLAAASGPAEAAAGATTDPAPRRAAPSLFASDFDYFAAGVRYLGASAGVRATVDARERLVELHAPEDLRRRLRRLPPEVRPDDGVLLLTADADRMQRALAEARREEEAWPRHQLLWGNSPILDWLSDRVRATFGRHAAPVLAVPRIGGPEAAAVIVSGVVSNRRGQPLVHRWYAARFERGHAAGVEPFADFLEASRLGREPLPNAGEPVDEERLAALLPAAIEVVERHLRTDRDRFRAESGERLNRELDRLRRLEGRRLAFLDERWAGRDDALALHRRKSEERAVRRLFADYQEWIEDAMTAADEPFLRIVAVLVGGAR